MLDSLVTGNECIIRIIFIRKLRRNLHHGIGSNTNLSLAFRTTLGGNQDDTIRTLHTINGGGRSILQYRDGSHRLHINA